MKHTQPQEKYWVYKEKRHEAYPVTEKSLGVQGMIFFNMPCQPALSGNAPLKAAEHSSTYSDDMTVLAVRVEERA